MAKLPLLARQARAIIASQNYSERINSILSITPPVLGCCCPRTDLRTFRSLPSQCIQAPSGFHEKKRIHARRNISTSTVRCLELSDGKTFLEWDRVFWEEMSKSKRSNTIRFSAAKVNIIRELHMVLVKDGTEFPQLDSLADKLVVYEALSSTDVIATSFTSMVQAGNNIVIQNRYHSIEEWEEIIQPIVKIVGRNQALCNMMKFITLDSREFKIDKDVNLDEHIDSPLVESFMEYLFSEPNQEFCQKSLHHYFKICHSLLSRYDLAEKAYGKAKNVVKIFSPPIMKECIHFLGETKYWKDAYHYRDMLEEWTGRDGMRIDAAVAKVALRNGDMETAFGLLGNYLNPSEGLATEPHFDSQLKIILSRFGYDKDPVIWKRNKNIVETLFLLLASKNMYPHSEDTAQKIADWFTGIKNEKWEYALIDSADIPYRNCPFTGVHLKQKSLTDAEYEYLGKVILREVIQQEAHYVPKKYPGGVQYNNTYAHEIKSFLTMMHENGPFDIVIDGMNLHYNIKRRQNQRKSTRFTAGDLASTWLRNMIQIREQHFGRKLNVLIVFKLHMRWETKGLYEDFATVWFSSDDSADDPYFLYGAVLSGKNCKLLTLDQLKDLHYLLRSKFDYTSANLIFKWQQIHQDLVFLKHTAKKTPQYFDVSVQRTPTTWHFPYYLKDHQALPSKWLCLKRTDMEAEQSSSGIAAGRGLQWQTR